MALFNWKKIAKQVKSAVKDVTKVTGAVLNSPILQTVASFVPGASAVVGIAAKASNVVAGIAGQVDKVATKIEGALSPVMSTVKAVTAPKSSNTSSVALAVGKPTDEEKAAKRLQMKMRYEDVTRRIRG